MDPTPVVAQLVSEYPAIEVWELRVVHRFEAGPNRLSSAYLLACENPEAPVRRFVAKTVPKHIADPTAICGEWRATRLALEHGALCPTLLFPDHKPERYLLLDYLEGTDAETTIRQGAEPEVVFAEIGRCLSQVHAIPAPRFGDFNSGTGTWKDWIRNRIEPRLADIGPIIGTDLQLRAAQEIHRLLPALDSEPEESRLMHRDIYLSNFILQNGQAHILDFGMAQGGRPLYDLAKLFVLDLYRFPAAGPAFLRAYFADEGPPERFQDLMALYLYAELVGMIRFFKAQGQIEVLHHAQSVFVELVEDRGRIVDLLDLS